jgi:hypothetical protein
MGAAVIPAVLRAPVALACLVLAHGLALVAVLAFVRMRVGADRERR